MDELFNMQEFLMNSCSSTIIPMKYFTKTAIINNKKYFLFLIPIQLPI